MEIAKLVLEYVKVILSASVVGGAVAIVFIVLFRDAIRAALGRLSTFKAPGGFEGTFEAQRQAAEAESKRVEKVLEPKALEINVAETMKVEDSVQAKISGPAPAPGSTPAATTTTDLEQAKRQAATFAHWWAFEKIYRDVFQSQIYLLRYLEGRPNKQAKAQELYPFYQQGVLNKGIAAATYPWENYLRFLVNWGLIAWEPSPIPGQEEVKITPRGTGFLQYIAMNNYNVNEKPN